MPATGTLVLGGVVLVVILSLAWALWWVTKDTEGKSAERNILADAAEQRAKADRILTRPLLRGRALLDRLRNTRSSGVKPTVPDDDVG